MNKRLSKLRAEAQRLAGEKHYTGRSLDLGEIEKTPDFRIFMDRVHSSYEFIAELVVKECIEVFSKDLPDPTSPDYQLGSLPEVVNRIANVADHFGVEK